MSFYMPTVEFNKLPENSKEVMEELVEKNRLVTMPRYDRSVHAKMVHNFLLKFLYRDTRWSTPLRHAWYMPHLVKPCSTEDSSRFEAEAEEIYYSGCFGSPQPVYLGDKQYLVTREDDTTFIMEVS